MTDDKPMTVDVLMVLHDECVYVRAQCTNEAIRCVEIKLRPQFRMAIEQYGREQYARGVNDAWPAGRGSGEPIAMLHDDGYWTHPPGRDPFDRFSGKVRMEVYAAPQSREPLTDEQALELATQEFPYWREDIQTAFVLQLTRAIERAHGIRSKS